ncbi:betaine/proline/choline family ABC transporter ATP-binding protein [Shinella sp.]|uniref:betaine/proline/choline family ABC transporter ATP-binding protein n=1 Tax=Shinella sp. TaxID=1870904 RepID=UPI003F72BE97
MNAVPKMQFDTSHAGEALAPVVSCRNVWKVFGHQPVVDGILGDLLAERIDVERARREHGCVVAVKGVSFDVRRSEVFCIMGLSGSGKSTLIRHVNRLIEPTAGDIVVNERSISALDARGLRELRARKIGMVFQNVALLPHRTVEENTYLPLELRGETGLEAHAAVQRALSVVGLSAWGDRYPSELSGGMQQRVGLARALAADADILLMDEPFSALDPLIRKQLQTEFRRLVKTLGKTALFITHDLDEAIRIGDRIAIMRDGQIVQTGTPAEIVLSPVNDYVAQFVEGISPVHFVDAERIMVPPTQYPGHAAALLASAVPEGWPVCERGTLLARLITLQTESDRPIAVADGGLIIGVVGPREILVAVGGHGKRQREM